MQVGASFKDAVERRLAGDGRVNPMYRQVVVVALKSATKGVGRYFNPQRDAGQTKEDARVQAKVRVCLVMTRGAAGRRSVS